MDVAADPVPPGATLPAAPAGRSSPPAEAETFRWRALTRGVPPLVWALTVLHLLLLVTYSVAVPPYRAPDEPAHVDLVLALTEAQGWPGPGERFFSAEVSASLLHSRISLTGAPSDIDLDPLEAHDAELRAARPSFGALTTDGPTPWHNQLTQHPPLFYALNHAVVVWVTAFTPDLHWSYDRVVGLLRLVSVALVAGLPLAAFAAARRLEASPPAATAAAAVPLGIPMLTHVGSSVNNDNLLSALFGGLFVLLTCGATGDRSRRTALWVGALSALALLTKGFALIVPLWVAGAYGLALARRGRMDRATLRAGGLALVTLVAGGWWWLRNIVVHGTVQPWGGGPFTPPLGATTPPGDPYLHELARLPERFWGAFGWTQVILPWGLAVAATLVVVAGVTASLTCRRPPPRWPRADVALLLLPTLLIGGLVLGAAWSGFARSGMVHGVQGRYLLVGVVGLAVATVLGADRLPANAVRWLPVAVLLAAAVMQVTALVVVVDHFWAAWEGLADSLPAMLLWSPWPRTALWALAGALLAATVAALLLAVRSAQLERTAPGR